MKKRVFYTEWAYVLGLILLAAGTALMEKADFGMSMVVAPAYIMHLKVSQALPFFSFGMAEYTLQALILAGMVLILRRVKRAYFFSFVTAVIYGFLLDGAIFMAAFLPAAGMIVRGGLLPCRAGGMRGRDCASVSYIYFPGGIRAVCEGNLGKDRHGYS